VTRNLRRRTAPPPGSDGLPDAVREAMLEKGVPAFDKRRHVEALITRYFDQAGHFCRTSDGRLFYFFNKERRLYDLDQRTFGHLLTMASGLSSKEGGYSYVLDKLQARTSRVAPEADVLTLSHYDSKTGLLAVSDAEGGVWLRERGEEWIWQPNGSNGLLFMTEPEAAAWRPDFGEGTDLGWFLEGFLFANATLTREEQSTLFLVWLLQQFFPVMRRTRVIPAFLGPQGSGKTTAMRRTGALLLGPRFEVTGLSRDREDAFVAAVTNRTVCALDNADSRIPWLEDGLATYATGHRYRLRRLYTTNDEVTYEPRAVLALSSRDPHFNRPDVSERLLPLYFDRPDKYRQEASLFSELDARRPAILAALMKRLGTIADSLAGVPTPAVPFRMADYGVFGWLVFAPRTEEWSALLGKLDGAQAAFASEGDGLVEALRELMRENKPLGPLKVADLFDQCCAIAESASLPFPRTAQGFGRRLTLMKRAAESELGVRISIEEDRTRTRWVTVTPKSADGAGRADASAGNLAKVEKDT
jgi:hypothetical protein